jgi:Family of unknown function (DUF6445)
MRFQPSPAATLEILRLGDEQTPLIRIDGALADASSLVHYAIDQASFERVQGNLYPGVRAAMPLEYVEGAVRALDPLVRSTYGLKNAVLANAECFFSIVTTPPSELRPLQKIPHIDTCSELHFAVVHYLCEGAFGGTAFYRQTVSGFERINREREPIWAAHRDQMLGQMPEDVGYANEETVGYEQIGSISCRFDRLILYPSNLLHSGLIAPGMPLSTDPAQGRLTANFFIGYRLP